MKNPFLTLFFIFFSTGLIAQNIVIEGKIIDNNNKEPIGYAHIGLPDLGIGTTSSNNGTFKLSIPKANEEEWFTVSFMGYKTCRGSRFSRVILGDISNCSINIVLYLCFLHNNDFGQV